MNVPEFLRARRSVRSFSTTPIDRSTLDVLISAALIAPAPHHSQPWRWAVLESDSAKQLLSESMGDSWSRDMQNDGVPEEKVLELVAKSMARINAAPAALLGCLTHSGLDRYPDKVRQDAEWSMAQLSLGAAIENLMLSATELGLATCWVAAPIFCSEQARESLSLPETWTPQALILVGNPDAEYIPRERPEISLDEFRTFY